MHSSGFVLAILLVFAASCEPKATVTTVQPEVPPRATSAPPDSTPPSAPHKPDGQDGGAGCGLDLQCTGYLRCIDGACKVPPAVEGEALPNMAEAAFYRGEELARFKIELAASDPERTRGLMFRRKMHPDFGMLFVFDDDRVRSFWMKNTYIPLDMVHVDSHGAVVGVVANAEPMTTSPRQTGKPARYVLELVAGKAAEKGIAEGATMRLENVPRDYAPRD